MCSVCESVSVIFKTSLAVRAIFTRLIWQIGAGFPESLGHTFVILCFMFLFSKALNTLNSWLEHC